MIRQAILSEKAYKQMESGIYTFLISSATSKADVVKLVKKQFGVDAVKVRIAKKAAKSRRNGNTRKTVMTTDGKKALVYLKAGQSISALLPKAEKAPKASKEFKDNKEASEKAVEKKESKGLLSKIRKPKKEEKEK